MTAKTSLPIVVCALILCVAGLSINEYTHNPQHYHLQTTELPPSIEEPLVEAAQIEPHVSVVVLETSLHDPMLNELSQEYGVGHTEISNIWGVVLEETHDYPIDPFLMMALIQEESSYNKTAKSHMGALGLTQVMPRVHHARLSHGETLTDPRVSIRVGVEVLNEYIQLEKGNIPRALQRYNGSLRDKNQKYARHILHEKSKLENLHIRSLLAQHDFGHPPSHIKA